LSASASSFHYHFQVPHFSLRAFPKISSTQNTATTDLHGKWYMPTRV
jgi:hypothetical protein